MTLGQFVQENAIRGACQCGECVDAPENPAEHQPSGHTVNLTFFEVAAKDPTKGPEMLTIVQDEFPEWLDGSDHSYLQVGGDLGDQGLGLMCIGLGDVLGIWKAFSPDIMFKDFGLDTETKMKMAGNGFVSLCYRKERHDTDDTRPRARSVPSA